MVKHVVHADGWSGCSDPNHGYRDNGTIECDACIVTALADWQPFSDVGTMCPPDPDLVDAILAKYPLDEI